MSATPFTQTNDIENTAVHEKKNRFYTIMFLICAVGAVFFLSFPSISGALEKAAAMSEEPLVAYICYDNKEPIAVVEHFADRSAPDAPVAGLWLSPDRDPSVSVTYIIGHNPGIFDFVEDMGYGDEFSLLDPGGRNTSGALGESSLSASFGKYVVADMFTVDEGTTLDEVNKRIECISGGIVLQACVFDEDGTKRYHIVAASRA